MLTPYCNPNAKSGGVSAVKSVSCARVHKRHVRNFVCSVVLPNALLLTICCTCAFAQDKQPGQKPGIQLALPAPVESSAKQTLDSDGGQVRIGIGDLLDIRVFGYAQLSRDSVRVDGRGMLRMPLIETEIMAACKTEAELEKDIADRYLKYLKSPEVSVFIKEYQSQAVSVIGAVKAPGRLLLQRKFRLLDLLGFVGGPTEQSGRSIQIIHANLPGLCGKEGSGSSEEGTGEGIVAYTLSETLKGNSEANPYLQSGDIVTLPIADTFFVIGNVIKPATYTMKDPVTLTRAIALAGGVLPDTKTEQLKIVRQTLGSTTKTEIIVNLNAVAKHQAEDVLLQPNDVVEVPPKTGGAKMLKDIFRTIVPTISSLPVRVIP
jgi:polysaccharide export outer membrane protein